MAVSDEFRENWLECQEEYGKNIESGDIPVLELDRIDESISLPAVKFTAPFNPNIDNQFDSYVHVPMKTFKKPIDDLAAQVSQATSDLVDLKQRTEQARQDAIAATDEASNVDADLTGMTVTITNRKGVSKEVNIGFEILERNVYPSIAAMNANAAYVRPGEFCMIATTDPTSPENAQLWSRNSSPSTSEHPFTFLSDLDQAATSAFADWLDNYKPVIEADHSRAEADHSRAETDHATASADHTQAGNDHETALTDHSTSASDHSRAETDHQTASADHTQAGSDHSRAETDHQTASADHTQAGSDHSRAETDHQTASSDHAQAGSDHSRADADHLTAVQDHTDSEAATDNANTEANRAKGYNDHPWEIGDDGFIYVWDEQTQAMVRTEKMIIDFSDLTPEQQAAMIQEFLARLTFDETPTAGSTNPVTSRGIKAALDQKQDTLTFATDALCTAAAAEIIFTSQA